jgi:tetratricopeptide (TPR) repeat protein
MSQHDEMPERPPSHVLGDRALAKFRMLFGEWVTHETGRNDYGIDALVEIFEQGRATGLNFRAQIKGTSKKKTKTGYSAQVRWKTLNYWRSQEVPVLVFLYAEESGAFYARWAHSYDPGTRRGNRQSQPGKVTFKFDGSHRINTSASARIAEEVRTARAFRERVRLESIPVRMYGPRVPQSRLDEIEARIQLVFQELGPILRLADSDELSASVVKFDGKRLRFSLPAELASVTIRHPFNASLSDYHTDQLVADIMIAAATAFANMGLTKQAVAITRKHGMRSNLTTIPEVAYLLAYSFMDEGDADGMLNLLVPGFISPDHDVREAAGINYFLLSQECDVSLTERGVALLLWAHELGAQLEREAGRVTTAAQNYYGKANVEKSALRFDDALTSFEQAAALDDRYQSRGYFHRERGGCFAELERWHEAVSAYEAAKSCDDYIPDIDYVLADSLVKCGRYAEALELLQQESDDEEFFQSKRKVLRVSTGWIVEVAGIGQQYRHQMLDVKRGSLDLATETSLVQLIAETDALDIRLLAHYAKALDKEDPEWGQKCFGLTAHFAHTCLYDASAWVLCVSLALELEATGGITEAFADLLAHFCRSEISSALRDNSGKIDDKEFARRVEEFVYKRARRPLYRHPTVLRFHHNDGTTDVVELNTST